VKEKLMNSNFEEVPFGSTTTDPRVKITVTNPPDTSGRTGTAPCLAVDMANRKLYIGQGWVRSDGVGVGAGITKVDMVTRQATYVDIPNNCEWACIYPIGITADNKVIFTARDTDNIPRVKLLDPLTDNVANVLDLTGGSSIVPFGPPALNTEDAQTPIRTVLHTVSHLILPPNWKDGLKVPKRIVVSSPGAGQLRVQAQFQLAPAQVRVRLWKIPDLTIVKEETLPGATSIDRTYSVTAGRYRAEVTAL